VGDDRASGAEGVGADPEHHRVAGTEDPAGIGEHVGAALEHEPDDTERCPIGLDRPLAVVDAPHEARTPAGRVPPPAEPSDHGGTHLLVEHQAGGRAAALTGVVDVSGVGGCDRGEEVVVAERTSEPVEEVGDRVVVTGRQRGECMVGSVDCCGDHVVDRPGDVQQRARGLDHHQPISGPERVRQLVVDHRHTIAAEGDLLPHDEPFQWCDPGSRRHRK
jgi:hypothetical protein